MDGGGVPHPVLDGGTPFPGPGGGYPLPRSRLGILLSGRMGYSSSGRMGYPPIGPGKGITPPPSTWTWEGRTPHQPDGVTPPNQPTNVNRLKILPSPVLWMRAVIMVFGTDLEPNCPTGDFLLTQTSMYLRCQHNLNYFKCFPAVLFCKLSIIRCFLLSVQFSWKSLSYNIERTISGRIWHTSFSKC